MRLEWDKPDARPFESGLDRGVLYLPNADGEYDTGVAWNGLTAIEHEFNDVLDSLYFDGVKYLDRTITGDLAVNLEAYTYPDAFLACEGIVELQQGLLADDQPHRQFSLAYRVQVESGYQIHILYNLMVAGEETTFATISETPEPLVFSWSMAGTPEVVTDVRPTAHIFFDSRHFRDNRLKLIEDELYGTADWGPNLPSLELLLSFARYLNPFGIIPDSAGGLAELRQGWAEDLTDSETVGLYLAMPNTQLRPYGTEGFYYIEAPGILVDDD